MLPAHDLVCFSHLRWDFVYQRPQHLLSRCARERRVFFVEEPVFDDGPLRLDITPRNGVNVVVPCLPRDLSPETVFRFQRALVDQLYEQQEITDAVLWYYTPMALNFTDHLLPIATVYDCMDELSAFRGAPPEIVRLEAELFARADIVFTGGESLYEAKRDRHPRVHVFPSSVDVPHFAAARGAHTDPPDQEAIGRPRLGFFGVIDERLDAELLEAVALARPNWQIVMVGPVVKIDPADLPRRANIHYLGAKRYVELPAYIAGWDVALLPFARNESTRFISPTKTPEYLAAGQPVVSTSICDVVRPYGDKGLVRIADDPPSFITAIESALTEDGSDRQRQADAFLAGMSWDRTWARMAALIDEVVVSRQEPAAPPLGPAHLALQTQPAGSL